MHAQAKINRDSTFALPYLKWLGLGLLAGSGRIVSQALPSRSWPAASRQPRALPAHSQRAAHTADKDLPVYSF